MADEIKKASEVRKDLYKSIEKLLGRELTEDEHQDLRSKMIGYVQTVNPNVTVKRIYTCRDCKKSRQVTKKTDQLIRSNQKGVETESEGKREYEPKLEELE